jgi:predicted DNA-binding protein with PD1-like motif
MAKIYLIEKGGKVPDSIVAIAKKEGITTARVECIGAVCEVELAFYNHRAKVYEVTKYSEEMEVTAMLGNICTMNNELILHVHGTFGRRDNSTIGGHVISAVADPFLEVVITKTENNAVREYDKELNLNVIKKLT